MEDFHGAKAAVFLGDKLLVYRRDDTPGLPFADHWDFPGGGREGVETPEQTLFREIEEEFGLVLTDDTICWKRCFPALHHPNARVWFFVLSLPSHFQDRVVFGDEGQEWAVMTWQDYLARDTIVPSFLPRMTVWYAETGGRLDRD